MKTQLKTKVLCKGTKGKHTIVSVWTYAAEWVHVVAAQQTAASQHQHYAVTPTCGHKFSMIIDCLFVKILYPKSLGYHEWSEAYRCPGKPKTVCLEDIELFKGLKEYCVSYTVTGGKMYRYERHRAYRIIWSYPQD